MGRLILLLYHHVYDHTQAKGGRNAAPQSNSRFQRQTLQKDNTVSTMCDVKSHLELDLNV